jgi:hypothetical protein
MAWVYISTVLSLRTIVLEHYGSLYATEISRTFPYHSRTSWKLLCNRTFTYHNKQCTFPNSARTAEPFCQARTDFKSVRTLYVVRIAHQLGMSMNSTAAFSRSPGCARHPGWRYDPPHLYGGLRHRRPHVTFFTMHGLVPTCSTSSASLSSATTVTLLSMQVATDSQGSRFGQEVNRSQNASAICNRLACTVSWNR